MPSLKTILSADSQPLRQELSRVEVMVKRFGTNIGKAGSAGGGMNGGWMQIAHSVRASFDSIASGAPAGRVLAQQLPQIAQGLVMIGNKIPGFSLLVRYQKDAATGAEALAEAYAIEAAKANTAALASTRKASATMAALTAAHGETEANLEAAISAEEKATADVAAAQAANAKAIASEHAAAAARAEAGAARLAIGPLGIVAGIIGGLAIGAAVAYKHTSALIDKLQGFKPPDFSPEYHARNLQRANQSLNVQKGITDEIRKQIELFQSAEKSANRVAEASKLHFEHLRKINELSNATDEQKARNLVKINAAERNREVANKIDERTGLLIAGTAKQKQAAAILSGIPSADHESEVIAKNKAYMDAAAKALADLQVAKNPSNPAGISSASVFKAYNAATASGVSGTDLAAAEKQIQQDATRYKHIYQESINRAASNAEIRARGEEMAKAAAEAFGKAAQIQMELPALRANLSTKNSTDALRVNPAAGPGMARTVNQQIGAYAMPQIAQQLDVLKLIAKNTDPKNRPADDGWGGVSF